MKTRLSMLLSACGGLMGFASLASAQVAYLGEVSITAGGSCNAFQMEPNGQLLEISEYTALHTLIGCTFGGDCETTFALPNMQQRAPLGAQDLYIVGVAQGSFEGTISAEAMAEHTHAFYASPTPATLPDPAGADLAEFSAGGLPAYSSAPPSESVVMATEAVSAVGLGAPFDITQPSLVTRFCINIAGAYPPINDEGAQ